MSSAHTTQPAGEIPEPLRAALHALRPALETQGVVQFHYGSYRLRYRFHDEDAGFVKHKSLPLGGADVAAAVELLLDLWRQELHAAQVQRAHAEQAEHRKARQNKSLRRLAQTLAGGGARRRQRIGKWFDDARNNPAEMLAFTLTGKFPEPPRAGRPARARLW